MCCQAALPLWAEWDGIGTNVWKRGCGKSRKTRAQQAGQAATDRRCGWKLFIANGYDEASTRQIAVRAGVALGTLFLYAANKRDLLFLVVNDELEDVAAKAAVAVRTDVTLVDNLLTAFRLLYEFFGREPDLSRLTL